MVSGKIDGDRRYPVYAQPYRLPYLECGNLPGDGSRITGNQIEQSRSGGLFLESFDKSRGMIEYVEEPQPDHPIVGR